MKHFQTVYLYGTDKRQRYLGNMLAKHGFNVIEVSKTSYETSSLTEITAAEESQSEILLLPIPVSKDTLNEIIPFIHSESYIIGGILPDYLSDICKLEKAHIFDYMKVPEVAILNAIATAEGAVCEAICSGDTNLHSSECLVIGYGKCGSVLADKLSGLKAKVKILTTSPENKAKAIAAGYALSSDDFSEYDYIFNTAPAMVITQERIDTLKKDCIIIDIASKPGGTDFDYCESKGVTAKLCLGLPAKYSPKTSAKIIFDEIMNFLDAS